METTDFAVPLLLSGLVAIWGILDCFFGYRIFRYTIAALGIICGGLAGWLAGLHFIPDPHWIPVALAAGAAVCGGILAWTLFQFALALVGSLSGGFMVSSFFGREDGFVYWILLCAAALIAALLAIFLVRSMIVLTTAFTGAFRFVVGTGAVLGGATFADLAEDPTPWVETITESPWIFYGMLVLGALGALFQLFTERGRTGARR